MHLEVSPPEHQGGGLLRLVCFRILDFPTKPRLPGQLFFSWQRKAFHWPSFAFYGGSLVGSNSSDNRCLNHQAGFGVTWPLPLTGSSASELPSRPKTGDGGGHLSHLCPPQRALPPALLNKQGSPHLLKPTDTSEHPLWPRRGERKKFELYANWPVK